MLQNKILKPISAITLKYNSNIFMKIQQFSKNSIFLFNKFVVKRLTRNTNQLVKQ